ncbi:MAG: hypothetical protein HY683_10325 [Chloroflexi bacterium]|nr:hypothetical protein [Chloroflexota bacterium]
MLQGVPAPMQRTASWVALLAVLALAAFLTYRPHASYPLPLHVDEWFHYAYAQAVADTESATFADPFFGTRTISEHAEGGFHILLAAFQQLTGADWTAFFRFGPAVLFTLMVLAAYAYGQRMGAGLPMALLVALLPTTLRVLGPIFLVPASVGMFLILVLLLLVHYLGRGWGPSVAVALGLAGLAIIHPTFAGFGLLITAAVAGGSVLQRGARQGSWPKLRWVLPVVALGALAVSLRLYITISTTPGTITLAPLRFPLVRDFVLQVGYIPIGLFVLGTFLVVMRGFQAQPSLFGLTVAVLGLLAHQVVFTLWGWGHLAVYERAWLFLALGVAVLGGFAVAQLLGVGSRLAGRAGFWPPLARRAAPLAAVALLAAAGVLGVRQRLAQPYYHVISPAIYRDLRWVRQNIPEAQRVLVDPAIAIAVAPSADKYVYAAIAGNLRSAPQKVEQALRFFSRDSGLDAAWLRANDIQVVYLPGGGLDRPGLQEVRKGVYVVADGGP